jgi:hypothetical protein
MDDFAWNDTGLPPELADRVRAELRPDERLVWAGQPRPDLMARGAWFLVPFGGCFALFALIWIGISAGIGFGFQGFGQGAGAFGGLFGLCGLPFLLIGIFFLFSPVWLRKQARRTVYALTDRRAVVWAAGWFGTQTVYSYGPGSLQRMLRTERADGAGDLVFEEFVTYGTDSHGARTATTNRRGFLAVDRVRELEDLVRRTLLEP